MGYPRTEWVDDTSHPDCKAPVNYHKITCKRCGSNKRVSKTQTRYCNGCHEYRKKITDKLTFWLSFGDGNG